MVEPDDAQRKLLASELAEALNLALDGLPCIHGFKAGAQVEIVDGRTVKPTVTFRCYECRQTMSYPPGMRALMEGLVSEFQGRFQEAGLTACIGPFKQNR
jgi:hypothetical protein